MEDKLNEIVDGVAVHYPMLKEKIMRIRTGPGESNDARYATYKLMVSAGFSTRRIALFFGAKHRSVKDSLTKYNGWLGIYKHMAAKYDELAKEILA